MEDYNYWITVYSVIFTLLIASLSINSILLIKGKINKLLFFFFFSGIYSIILNYFFSYASIGYMEQDFLSTFIYKGYSSNLFFGILLPIISVTSTAIILIRIILNIRNFYLKKT